MNPILLYAIFAAAVGGFGLFEWHKHGSEEYARGLSDAAAKAEQAHVLLQQRVDELVAQADKDEAKHYKDLQAAIKALAVPKLVKLAPDCSAPAEVVKAVNEGRGTP